jgi:asparagine synthase (glutamine-hydrolysing)
MSGLFGVVVGEKDKGYISGLMELMANSMNHNGSCIVDVFNNVEKGYGAGRVSLGILNQVKQPIKSPDKTCLIVFHGELYGNTSGLSDPEYVLSRYIVNGDDCAIGLDGIFHFFIYDNRTDEIKLYSDKFGIQPLYYSVLEGGLVFGAEVKSLLWHDRIDRTPDYSSFGDFFHYGQILGEKTLFENIKLLAPGSILTFNNGSYKISIKKYWCLDSIFAADGNYDQNLTPDEAVDYLIESIQKCSSNKENIGLSLSGGLDSRGILAGLQDDTHGLLTYTLGLEGCADQKLAERMAHIAKTKHEFIVLDQSYLSDFENMAMNMIKYSDGMYHPHESTEMLALEYLKKAKFKILLRGHGGEIAKANLAYPVMVNPEVYSLNTGMDILGYIFNQTNLILRDIDHGKLFSPPFRDLMREAPLKSLQDSCLEVAKKMAPADVCIYYYTMEHIRRQVVASLDIFRTETEIRMPYISEEYLRVLLQLPVGERYDGEIHHKLVKKCMPELMKIRNSNTGAPLDAGPARLFWADKFNSLMKKLNIYGYRHYTEFQKWHRKGFQESSRDIIFSDLTADRNLYNMDYMAQIFDLHVSGKRNYGHLLGTIVGLELWFRSFVD